MRNRQEPHGTTRRTVWNPPIAAVNAGFGGAFLGLFGLGQAISALSSLRAEKYRVLVRETDLQVKVLELQIELAVGATIAVLLGVGGVLILIRRAAGPTMVVIGSGLAFFALLGDGASSWSGMTVFALYALAPAAILVAALWPSCQRWVATSASAARGTWSTPYPAAPSRG
ncbi:hypothetical protein [Nocardia rhizosphaerae]|uniref:Uncharacterized protein n=1 Tax=Nocardia rhizosphaerae TaxID=1691571 RepID=A0ABV8L196_9NOCA